MMIERVDKMVTLMYRDGLHVGRPATLRGLRAMLSDAALSCDWRTELVLAGRHRELVKLGFVELVDLHSPKCAGMTWSPPETLRLSRMIAIWCTNATLAHRVVYQNEYAVFYGDGSIYTPDGADCTDLAYEQGMIAQSRRTAEIHLGWSYVHYRWTNDTIKRPYSHIAPSRGMDGSRYGSAAVAAYCTAYRRTRCSL